MPAVLDQDKPKLGKPEAFVEKQIEQARGRIRTLDFFQTGLVVLIASLAFTFALVLVDRAYETPRGMLWTVIAAWIFGLAGYVWFAVFRQSRRHINPFYAARQVEQTIPDAKNSVINYVDLQDDESVPASVKASIGAKAAKDMKQVDLNQAIQKKQVLWLAAIAGAFFIAVLVASFLPATRTTMKLLSPKEARVEGGDDVEPGNVTIGQGEDVTFKVELKGRIPEKDQPDKPRVRIWYNPDDPDNFEERPLEPVEGERNVFGHTLSAKQVRNGFFYQVFAGNVKTPAYEVKLRIIPQFTGNWEVEYAYPAYLGRAPEKRTDPNLVGYFNTQVTLTAHANRPVQSAVLEIDGATQSYSSVPVDNDPEAMRFQFPMTANGRYRIRFVTTERKTNPDPQWFRMSLIDPKPVLRFFDVTYDYPPYLRYEKVTVNVREPRLEANRGTLVTIVAHANRPIKQAQIQMDGIPGAIQGTLVKEQPMQATFKLPALMADGAYHIGYTPDTGEAAAEPLDFSIKVITDNAPQVAITKPQQQVSEIPANGNLPVEGIATDDHGLTRMNLRFEVIKPAPNVPLSPKAYRSGVSFKREADGSYPNRIDYKDLIELAKLEADGKPFAVQEGMEIEFWLEAIDNCDVPPGPNSGMSAKLRIKVLAPEMNPEKKKQQEKDKQNFEQEKKQHEQQQDQKNEKEERIPDQKKPMGEPGGEGEPGAEQPQDGPKKEGGKGMGQPKEGDPPPDADNSELKKQEDKVKDLLAKNNPMGGAKNPKTEPNKDDPKEKDPAKEPKPEPKKDEKPDPRQLPKPEDVNKLAEKLDSRDKKEHDEAREQIKKNIEQAKNDPRKPDEAQKQLDEHRKKLDEPERKQFDESLERVAKEMQDIQREKRVQDAVDKITSGDKQMREQGQKDLENELRDPKTKEDTERQLQNLAGDMGTERKKQIGDATDLAKENAKNPPKKTGPEDLPPPKEKEDENVEKLAKKNKDGTPEEKKEAQEQLEKALRDPAQRDKVQKQLDDFKDNIKDRQEREDFEKAMKEIAENAKKDKGPSERKAEEIQKLAEQLKSDDKKERDAAQKQIEEALKQADKDPKATADAQKQLKEARDGIKEPMKQERFDRAVKEINEAVQKHRQEQAAAQEKMKKDLDDVAKGLNDKDPAKQKEAQQKLEQMLKDPKTREQVKNELDKLKQGAGDPRTKENIDKATEKAVDDVARKESLEKIANDLNGKDGDRKNSAQKKLEEKLSDPKTREQVKNDLEKLKEGMKDKEAKDNLDKAVGEAEKSIAQNKQEAEKLASDLNSKDPAKQKAAQDKLEEMLKDPAKREQVKNELDKLKKADPNAKENIDKALEKANDDLARQEELERIANGLNSKNPDKQKAARQKLEDQLADPKSREQVKNDLQKFKESLKDQGAKDKIAAAVDRAEKNIAKNKQEAEKIAQDLTGKDKGKQEAAQRKLEEMLGDPAKRDQLKRELERIKKELADDQAKAKIDEAMKNAEANNLAKKDAPKKEDLEKIANDLKSKDAAKEKAAERKLRDALKDPRTRAKVEKDFNDIKDKANDPGEKQRLVDALNKAKDQLAKLDKPLDPKEIEKLVRDLKSKDPKAAEEARKKLDEMLDDPDMRQKLAKALEELMKDAKGDTARKELEDQIKNIKTLGDLKHRAKAGDLVLEDFKRNITNEEFRKKLGWTEEQIRKFQEDYEKRLLALKKQIELAEQGKLLLPRDKGGKSSLDTVEKVRNDPTDDGSNPLHGGKYIAPPGFGDPYKRFTEDVSGVRPIQPATELPKK